MEEKLKYKSILLGAATMIFLSGQSYAAPDAPDSVKGAYGGTFICALGEMGMTLSLDDVAQTAIESREPCRSASGKCNNLRKTRLIGGVLNFFPTTGNPNSPSGAFKVTGTVKRVTKTMSKIDLEPGDWIEKPENFGSSGLTARIVDGTVYGEPTADGCHALRMRRLHKG